LTYSWSNIKSNIVDWNWQDALSSVDTDYSSAISVSPWWELATLKLTSVTPFETNQWQLDFSLSWVLVSANNVQLKYLKPFAWKIEVKNPTTWNWDWNINLWTLQQYRLQINNKDNKGILNNSERVTSDITISNNLVSKILEYSEGDYIKLNETKLSTWAKLIYKPQNALSYNIEFQTRVETKTWVTLPTKITEIEPWVQIKEATISYTLDEKSVKYYLSPEDGWVTKWDNMSPPPKVQITTNNPIPITKTNPVEFLWVRVIWWIQWWGNSEFTWQNQNISSISSMESRTQIRKNAYTYTSSMTKWQIVNWVRYEEWNVAIWGETWDLNYETLVVKNGNVIINWNLNTNNNKLLWIIVIKDGYSVTEDWENSWNVYVTPEVQNINAIIYADWWLISVQDYTDNKVTFYDIDSTARSQQLWRQLYMNWSLFTRNTIWWAVLTNQTDWKYTLPWWTKTTEFNLALQYDLNYVRRWKGSCGDAWWVKPNQTPEECIYAEPFIIKYDPRVQTTPPKLFEN
jgi:hypothetical protein